jgi:hypothetical protein
MSSIKTAVPERAAPALHDIDRGMTLRKCRKCGCMKEALDAIAALISTNSLHAASLSSRKIATISPKSLLPTRDRGGFRAYDETVWPDTALVCQAACLI